MHGIGTLELSVHRRRDRRRDDERSSSRKDKRHRCVPEAQRSTRHVFCV